MKKILLAIVLLPLLAVAQITDNDGDWSEIHVTLSNTPEAELMVRTGDIDNLGFGWPANFDPFSGQSTPSHSYPWAANETDPDGTDRIMVISSYNGNAPLGRDGYTAGTSRPSNSVRPITLTFSTSLNIHSAILQIFVDDFQAPVWGANYTVYIDNVRNTDLEKTINSLIQTGPIGKMINYKFPDDLLYLLNDGELSIKFDDLTSGAGDGYAIDFVKLLINPVSETNTNANIRGKVTDSNSGEAIEGAIITIDNNKKDTTDAEGNYEIHDIIPGIVQLRTYKEGYGAKSELVDIQSGQTKDVNFQLTSPVPRLIYISPNNNETFVSTNRKIKLVFDQVINSATFNSASFILSDQEDDISGTYEISNDTLIFTPNLLLANKTYEITITTSLKNSAGVSLEQDSRYQFSTNAIATSVLNTKTNTFGINPNPVKEVVHTDFVGDAKEYYILNSLSQIVQQGKFSQDIRLKENFNPGIYFMSIVTGDNKIYSSKLFITK